MAQSFIGSLISLTSTSDIRYRGVLQEIDHASSTIQLADVYSMGTEARRPPNEFLPANPKPYDYIVFRATEVKDLVVERRATEEVAAAALATVHDDPAVIGASSGGSAPPPSAAAAVAPVPQPEVGETVAPSSSTPAAMLQQQQQQRTTSRNGSIRSAEVAVESVGRAMDALRVTPNPAQQQLQQGGGGRRGGGGGGRRGGAGGTGGGIKGPGVVPETPFDFLQSNARFDKAPVDDTQQPESPGSTSTPGTPPTFYDKKKSFFDDISSDSKARTEGGVARQRRDEERMRNLNTFGETGMSGWHGGGGGGRGGRDRGGGDGGRRGGGGRRRGGGGRGGGSAAAVGGP